MKKTLEVFTGKQDLKFQFFNNKNMSKILVIEDEAAIRRVLVKILSEESEMYEVDEAED